MIETSCAEKRERGTKMKSIKRLAAAVLAFVMLFTAAVGMTTAAAEGAAIPGAAAKTAPTALCILNPICPVKLYGPSGRFKPAANRDMRLMQ